MKPLYIIPAIVFLLTAFSVTGQAQVIFTIAGSGTSGSTGNGGPATAATLRGPAGIVIDIAGNVYFNDVFSQEVRKVSPAGIITRFAGNGTGGYSGDGGPATNAAIYNAQGVALDAVGNLYIADASNNRVRKVDTFGIITTVVGIGTGGYSGDGGQATNAKIFHPTCVSFDRMGNMYISDEINNVIRKVNTLGIISTVAGNNVLGYSGDGGPATNARLNGPYYTVSDTNGVLYIADWNNNRIRKVDTFGVITTVCGTGTTGYSGDGGAATAAQIDGPLGVGMDKYGNVYFADSRNKRIRTISTAGIISSVAGNGIAAYAGDGGPATAASLLYPYCVAFDTTGNMFIADNQNYVVRKVVGNAAALGLVEATAGCITVFPNPGNGTFVLTGRLPPGADDNLNLQLVNMAGQIVYDRAINANGGTVNQPLFLSDILQNGLYIFQLTGRNERYMLRIEIRK